MSQSLSKILSLFISFCLILEQSVFAQTIDLSHYFARNPAQTIPQSDKFRPLHLRYISYDNQANDFKILLDKGDYAKGLSHQGTVSDGRLEQETQELMKYFFIGLSLPNEKFWVNLRPDSPDNILDPDLEKTDIGKIFLEADLQLKKDTSGMTSPQTKEGREYWDKLYKKAGELFGSENITIPTITRPWIVPNEIIIREAPDNAYIYKATLKVMLEEDYLTSRGGSRTATAYQQSAFSDPRLKELNEYSTQLIRETIIPKLTYAVNTAKRYAPLRQVYYSLILAQWFKQKYGNSGSPRAPGTSASVNSYINLIDSGNLVNLASSQQYDKQGYFRQYQKSFQDGEYNLQEPVYAPMGQSIRRYVSGGIKGFMSSSPVTTTISAEKDRLIKIRYGFASPIHYPVDLEKQLWVRIEEELKSIKRDDGQRKYYIDVQRKMHDDAIFNDIEQSTLLVRVKDTHQGYDLVKVGKLFFIDKEVYEDLEENQELRAALKERVIIVSDLSQSTIGESEESGGRMKLFTSATILLILNSHVAEKCVIDAGSGDGLLALTALRQGASQAIVIDSDKVSLNKARQDLEANDFKEGEHFWCIAGDLRDKNTIIPKIPDIKDSIVLVSNIGTWPSDYKGVTNLTSVELIVNVARKRNISIDEIILGGYQSKEYIEHLPDGDIAELKKYGFQPRPEQSQVGGCVSISVVSSSVEADEKSSFQPHVNYATSPLGDEAWILSILANGDYNSSEALNILGWLDSLSKTLWKWYIEFGSDKYISLQSIPTFDYKVRGDGIPRSRVNSQYPKVKAVRKQIEKYLMGKYVKSGQHAVKADSNKEAEVFSELSKMIRAVYDDFFVLSREGNDSQTIYSEKEIRKNINKKILEKYPYDGYVSDIKSIDNKSLTEFLEGILNVLYDFCKYDFSYVDNLTKKERRKRQEHYSDYIDKIIAKQLEMMIAQISSEEKKNARKDLLNSLIDASKLHHILSQENLFPVDAIGRAMNFHQLREIIKDSYQNAQYIIKILITAAEIAAEENVKPIDRDLSSGKEEKASSILVEIKEDKDELGGIDLRALPITIQPVKNNQLPAFGSSPIRRNINFGDECRQVESMLNNDFIPATARIWGIAYAAYASSSLNDKRIETVISYIAQILRKQEEHLIATEPALKQILIALESDKLANEVQLALKKIDAAPNN